MKQGSLYGLQAKTSPTSCLQCDPGREFGLISGYGMIWNELGGSIKCVGNVVDGLNFCTICRTWKCFFLETEECVTVVHPGKDREVNHFFSAAWRDVGVWQRRKVGSYADVVGMMLNCFLTVVTNLCR